MDVTRKNDYVGLHVWWIPVLKLQVQIGKNSDSHFDISPATTCPANEFVGYIQRNFCQQHLASLSAFELHKSAKFSNAI